MLRVLGNEYNPQILSFAHEPRSAQELSDELDVPIATCYRRIEELQEADLLEHHDRVLSDYDVTTVGEGHAIRKDQVADYAGDEGRALHSFFQFDHVALTRGDEDRHRPRAFRGRLQVRVGRQDMFHARRVTGRPAVTAINEKRPCISARAFGNSIHGRLSGGCRAA